MRYFILQYWAADNALLSAGRLFVRYTGIGSTDTRRAPCERVVFQNRCPRLYTLYPQSDAAREPLPLCPRRAAHSLLTPSPPDDPRDDDDGAAGAPSSQLAVFRPKPPATRWTVPMHRALVATAQPTLGASSSRGARSPMTRGGATAWSVCVCCCPRALPYPSKRRRLVLSTRQPLKGRFTNRFALTQ